MIKTISQGAEAIISLNKNILKKNRVSKSYRLPALDYKLRESRTRKELKILERASNTANVPKVISNTKFEINMEYLNGEKLSETLNYYKEKKQAIVMREMGKEVAKLHSIDIIHGDLTTSNTLLKDKKVYIIDFGLGYISNRIEDRAVDLHLIKQALQAKHFKKYEKLFAEFLKSYEKSYERSKEVVERLKKVESRGRYKF